MSRQFPNADRWAVDEPDPHRDEPRERDCHSIAQCDYPQDNTRASLTDLSATLRWQDGKLYVNGFRPLFHWVTPNLETMAQDVLNVVLDPVPPELVTPFAEQVIAKLGPSWVMQSDAIEGWLLGFTGCRVEHGALVPR